MPRFDEGSVLERRWLTARAVRRLTGRSLTSIYAALQDGELEGNQRGQNCSWRVHIDAVDRWMSGEARA
jgi:hypothetical protein